jgi:hypothetical protein
MTMKPFANESETLEIGDLKVENRVDRVEIFGSVHLTKDKAGLASARALKALADDVVAALEATPDLPDQVQLTNAPRPASDPFRR